MEIELRLRTSKYHGADRMSCLHLYREDPEWGKDNEMCSCRSLEWCDKIQRLFASDEDQALPTLVHEPRLIGVSVIFSEHESGLKGLKPDNCRSSTAKRGTYQRLTQDSFWRTLLLSKCGYRQVRKRSYATNANACDPGGLKGKRFAFDG